MATRDRTKQKRPRRTQEERREATRAALLDATIESLIEYGYAGVTTTKVVERAGVSRGAQVHHFHTKAELVAEAIRRLAERRMADMEREVDRLPKGRDRIRAALDLLWKVHSDRLFEAALELWVAARTDKELRKRLVPVEHELIEATFNESGKLFGDYASAPAFASSLQTALSAIQGLALYGTVLSVDARAMASMWEHTRERLVLLFDANGGKAPGSRGGKRRK